MASVTRMQVQTFVSAVYNPEKSLPYQHTADYEWLQLKFLVTTFIFGALRNQNYTDPNKVGRNLGIKMRLENVKFGKQLLGDGFPRPCCDITASQLVAAATPRRSPGTLPIRTTSRKSSHFV